MRNVRVGGIVLCIAAVLAACSITQADVIDSTEDSYLRSGSAGSNYDGENRILVGWHPVTALEKLRGVVEFDLSSLAGLTVTDVNLALTIQTIDKYDQDGGTYDLVLKNLGESFDESSVTWNSLTPDGGDISGGSLSTLPGFATTTDPGTDSRSAIGALVGTDVVFPSTAAFIAAAQDAIDNNAGILSLVIHAPGAEDYAGGDNALYRFESSVSLEITAIPEPATMSVLALGGLAILRRRRR